ncbi:cation:proton antiporter domain-containing protein [Herpetosiphon llansteffanensis]|uniref:cation:proton antiporter domain-containing protein n=1 Tax=Herpetosiphon llansteffanensis TaxID=2094568 RepID=UPI000D7CCEC5|nr:cation:proton antiporter [Herpetosiphon llansteffanensis]
MPHDISLITNISVALVAAFAGGLLARRLGLPTIVGYLLAGMLIGPFTPGFKGDVGDISQLAEIGVIFLMFGVGLHFSLKDLWAVRKVAIPGAALQMLLATGLGFGLTRLWGWSTAAGLVMGLALSIASTVVLLRGLMDAGELNTPAGQTAVGWLVLEDLATVLILVLLPAFFGSSGGNPWAAGGIALLKTTIFVVLILFAGGRFLPWLLTWISHSRSRELFILASVAVALGTAFAATAAFEVSLALGAFLAGVVLGESDLSHQIGDEVLPFREIFAVIFFVSVGMLVNPIYVWNNIGQVIALTALIVFGKAIFTLFLGLILPSSGRTMIVVAAGLSQIGEFSFIVGQAGVGLGVLTQDQYSLLLAGAIFSIMLNPVMFWSIPHVETWLKRYPRLWARFQRHATIEPEKTKLPESDHVVVVGYGRVGEHIGTVLQRLKIPFVVVEADNHRADDFMTKNIPTLIGDAANSEVLTHAKLDKAKALVVTLPNEAASELVVAAARDLAPNLPIVARAATNSGVERLADLGAQDVIHPELEGGLEIIRHTLLRLGYAATQVQGYTDAVRRDQYHTNIVPTEHLVLEQLIQSVRGFEIAWRNINANSSLVGQSLAMLNFRAQTGASVIAVLRDQQLISNPESQLTLEPGDTLGVIGDESQIQAVDALISRSQTTNPPPTNRLATSGA